MAYIPFLNNAYFSAKVGIGADSPSSQLAVASTGANPYSATLDSTSNMKGIRNVVTSNTDDMVGIYFATGTTTTGTHWSGITGSRTDNATDWGTQLNFYTHDNSVAGLNLATQKMVIKGDGNVGIGTTSPGARLEVQGTNTAGDLALSNSSTTVSSGDILGKLAFRNYDGSINFSPFSGEVASIRAVAAVNFTGTNGANTDLLFYTNSVSPANGSPVSGGSEKMRITSTGGISFGSTGTAYGTSGQILKSNGNASPTWIDGSAIPGVPGGSGTVNTVAMWTPDGDTLGNSPITISGNDITSSGRSIIENTTALTTGVVDSLLIKTLSSGTSITNGFGGGLSFYLENTVYSAVNEVGKIAVIETDTIAIDDKMVFSVKDNNILAERLTLTGSEAVFTGNVGIGVTGPGAKLDIVGSSLGIRVKKADLSDVLRVYTQGSGIFMDNGNVHISDDLKIGATLLSNQENTDVDSAAAEVVAQVSTTYTAAFFDFVVKKTTNVRSGTVYACHDGTNVEFTETSTNDLGDTSDVTLSVDISGTNMRLLATVTSDDWSVKSLIRAI